MLVFVVQLVLLYIANKYVKNSRGFVMGLVIINKKIMSAFILPYAVLLLSGLFVVGCANTMNTQGQIIPEENFAKLEPGTQNKLAVLRLLGSPSSESLFAEKKWLYITTKTQKRVLTHDEVKDREIVILAFDDNDMLSNITKRTAKDGRDIAPLPQRTKTHGQSLGILDQMFENLGQRFGNVE